VPALSEILARYPMARVTFLGTGEPIEATLQRFEPALRHRVTAVSHYRNEELPMRLDGHQIKLFPSLSEGFGRALLEAMACGLAPVTTATSGPLEFVKQGENGIVVPPRDSDALVGAMMSLLESRELLDRLRRAAHATAQGMSWRALADRRLELYEEFRTRLKRGA
jgi:glycosyltransferase involved in cell wall biosynthesis